MNPDLTSGYVENRTIPLDLCDLPVVLSSIPLFAGYSRKPVKQ